jgi:dihydrolipoamide dehydrogenase
MAERGRVAVDATMKTSVDNIYAIGDIVPTTMLAHVASKEGFVAVDNIMGQHKEMKYHAVPGCVFTTPEISSVGTLEWQLQKEGKQPGTDYKTGTFELRTLGKAQASGHLTGFVKVIVDTNDVLIGAEIVGDRAADMLQVLTTAIDLGLTASQVGDSIFPHPTMCEGIMEALHDVHGVSVHKA